MRVVYAGESLIGLERLSIFMAGPTPRTREVASWRPAAIEWLSVHGFPGVAIVPEPKSGHCGQWPDYDTQCTWEQTGLDGAGAIVFWVPRNMKTLPGLTTNVEFGLYASTSAYRCVLGAPDDAEHMRYLDFCARKYNIPRCTNLEETLRAGWHLAAGLPR